MSTSSSGSLGRRIAKRGKPLRSSTNKLPHVSQYDAYDFTLRAAYLHHLLQPKAKRLQHGPAPRPQVTRSPTAVADLVKDSFVVRDSKSTRLPKEFMSALDRRLTGVLTGQERMQEYNDANVKRTFALFLNEFKRPEFRRSMDKDRKVEDLLLIFFSTATKELVKTKKSPEDDSWKLMVDRYVALFVRLVSSVIKDNDWAKEKPELSTRLLSLENKLLTHDRDLAAASQRNGGAGGTTVEVEVPRSQNVKDMPMVLTVATVFKKDLSQVQGHIDEQREFLTEKSALRDLKLYQTSLSLSSRRTLRKDDFDTDEAYDSWRKSEVQDISQLISKILQSSPELLKGTPGILPQARTMNGGTDHSRNVSTNGTVTPHLIDQTFDFGSLNMNGDTAQTASGSEADSGEPYMFIPPDPHAYYRQALKQCWLFDMQDGSPTGVNGTTDAAMTTLLSKKSTELLNEVAMRWRIPPITRLTLFKDLLREMLSEHNLELDLLNAALTHIRDSQVDTRKSGSVQRSDSNQWPMADYAMNQQILTAMHDILLRDLFEELLQCFNIKPIEISGIMAVLENHIYEDPLFSKTADDLDQFTDQLHDALLQKAHEFYDGLATKHLRPANRDVEFFDVMELGKDVVKHGQRIQKRYRKIPTIMGVEPAVIFVKVVLPAYAKDAHEQISTVLDQAKARQEELPMQDGFELYKEMVQMRQIHNDVLPNIDFAFHVEGLLAPFVWRWIATTDQSIVGWVEAAVKQDHFQTRNQEPNLPPSEAERHSVSVIDIFRSFNEAIEQVVSLNWDDDYQYAKFMTALSKSIGAGLTRYCEQLERYFVQEMDRLTPEQDVSMTQTRQERWVRIAKDAMSTKEKMEPFQFLPESFVKLNNIEWAMLQLDKLEKEMNVDTCATVIDKHEPQAPKQRKAENYVFTVKIIEAEDLKACDVNGLSDPYVVLGDEFQKRLAKTRIIYGNLNPRWDETTDIITQGPLNVIATIWDWDVMGDHDMVGRTSIKLDPSHFRDFLPREYWLDLDTQGRLLVRVSMEGEKDDIRFYFGKAFRTLKRSEREMTRKITDKLSAYIHHCLSKRTLRSLTSKPMSIQSVSSYFQRNRPPPAPQRVPAADIENALQPLFAYFNENFAIMKQTLTNNAMITVMTRLWKETLATLESLLVPPLSDKASAQRQLNEQELEIVFKWLECLFDFFHAYDDESKSAQGVPQDILKSPKYHDLKNLNFFYYEPTDTLIRTSERMAVATMDRQREAQARSNNRLSAPGAMSSGPSFAGTAGLMGQQTRRSKTVMNSRNLGTMKKAKQEKRQEAQAEPSDDMILRILRMRPEAERYLRDRSRQKERLAAAAAAEMIVRQSLAQGAAREREIRREMALNRR